MHCGRFGLCRGFISTGGFGRSHAEHTTCIAITNRNDDDDDDDGDEDEDEHDEMMKKMNMIILINHDS